MYIREVTQATKQGPVTYLYLTHNEWDPQRKTSVQKTLKPLGRADRVDRAGLERLVESISTVLGVARAPGDPGGVGQPTSSVAAGGAWVLDGVWRQLGLDTVVLGAVGRGRGRPRDLAAIERVLFALVANRALAPSSKLAAVEWMNHDVAIPGLAQAVGWVGEDACYRGMDYLTQWGPALARSVYEQVTDALNLEVDVLFFDTTSTYFQVEDADEALWRDTRGRVVAPPAGAECGASSKDTGTGSGDGDGEVEAPPAGGVEKKGFRTWGKSKDHRDDLPQVVIGMAVTRSGVPLRVWSWPGSTTDTALIRQVRADMRAWNLSRIIYAADRGFASAENRRDLMSGGDGYILGEKLRSGSKEAAAALSRPGRYHEIAGNLQVKEVNLRAQLGTPERFIVCFNPDQAPRDAHTRHVMISRLEDLIEGSDTLSALKRAELKGRISTMPGPNRFLRTTPSGLLRVDRAKVHSEARLDGKYLLRTSDPHLSAQDIALGYKQLLHVERGWRDMKSTLDLRPVFHRLEDRIRAHITLCWLALLLIRVIENKTHQTWPTIRREMQRLHLVTLTTPHGLIQTHTPPTPAQTRILHDLDLTAPPAVHTLTP